MYKRQKGLLLILQGIITKQVENFRRVHSSIPDREIRTILEGILISGDNSMENNSRAIRATASTAPRNIPGRSTHLLSVSQGSPFTSPPRISHQNSPKNSPPAYGISPAVTSTASYLLKEEDHNEATDQRSSISTIMPIIDSAIASNEDNDPLTFLSIMYSTENKDNVAKKSDDLVNKEDANKKKTEYQFRTEPLDMENNEAGSLSLTVNDIDDILSKYALRSSGPKRNISG